MARSKAFEALMKEAGKAAEKSGEALKQIAPFDSKTAELPQTNRKRQKKSPPEKGSIISGSEQYQHRTDMISVSDQSRTGIRSESDQNNIRMGSYQGQDHITTTVSLSSRQQQIYDCLLLNGMEGSFTKPQIQKATGIPYITIRKALSKFVNSRIIGLEYDACQKITYYRINPDIQIQKFKKDQDQDQIRIRSDQDQNTMLYSSSSFYNKTATDKISTILADHHELGYWRQKGLTEKQIKEWMKIAECGPDIMVQYLCFCRFEMVDNGLEESKPVGNVFNWFFKILERTGCYPKPKNYKSFREKDIEREKAIVEERERQMNEARELYQRKIEAEKGAEFWEMMNDPEGETYKACFEKLPKAMKSRRQKGGKMFETAMRKAFDEMMVSDGR